MKGELMNPVECKPKPKRLLFNDMCEKHLQETDNRSSRDRPRSRTGTEVTDQPTCTSSKTDKFLQKE